MSTFKVGDVVTCLTPNIGNKNRPCFIIEITDTHYITLPITSNEEINSDNKIQVDIDVLSCCMHLHGYILFEKQELEHDGCVARDCNSCDIGWKLKALLSLKGIKL